MITLIVLAAGGSSRMGSAKQLARVGGITLVRRAVLTAIKSKLGPVIVVTGAAGEAVRAEIADVAARMPDAAFSVRAVENRGWADGVSTSIRAGVQAAGAGSGILLMMADQPGVSAEHLRSMAAALRPPAITIVSTQYGLIGPPVLFDARHRPALCALSGDRGARSVIEANAAHAASIPLDSARLDVDTPEDLRRAEQFPTDE
ncbi:MAG: nucleotidyltransferase family protein [Phycisphaerales bacterium]|nr:nucleotidyltransferase family protein [Phycisphaerales bacterium]